jgi:hypothetical protein
MWIATGPLTPITELLQVLGWIFLPLLIVVTLITTWHHYLRKRKHAANALDAESLHLSYLPGDQEGAYLYFDHSGIVKQYEQKLFLSQARYCALRKDYEKLEDRLKEVSGNKIEQIVHLKSIDMENERPMTSEEMYLKDLVEENRAQVVFLQTQLEQRIRKQHDAESEMQRIQTERQQLADENENLLREKEALISSSSARIQELQQQNELLNASAADSQDKLMAVNGLLEEEKDKRELMEKKLQTNKQLLQRLFKEFASCVEEEERSTMVVPMQPAYLNSAGADL